MLLPNIPQGFGLELLIIVEMSYVWLRSRRNRSTPSFRAFFRLCSAFMLFLLIDIPVRFSDLGLVSWDPGLVYVLNGLFIILETVVAYTWFTYFMTVQNTYFLKSRANLIISIIPFSIMLVLICISWKTGWLFYVDDSGTYMRGTLFLLQFLIPYSYLIASFFSTFISYRKTGNKRMFTILLFSFVPAIISSVLQAFYSGSFTHMGLFLSILLIYIEMYQYELKQIDKMRSLSDVNRELSIVNQKLGETVRDLEISIENEKKASNAKSDFLSRMSHDMRTPLNGILGLISIDDRNPDDVELLAENRKKAKAAAEHLMSLINDVLDMSKLEDGKVELAHEPFLMSETVSSVTSLVQTKAIEAGVSVIDENENDTFSYPYTYGSPLHIRQVLLNIIDNGIKYNRENGKVRIRLLHKLVDDDHINYIIRISDTGIGISKEYTKKLFEPFSQEHIDARSVYGGTGLGMAITKGLVDKMGGNIEVVSSPGEGTTFILSLTFEIAPVPEDCREADVPELNLEGVHILLAEDNELNSEIAVTLLGDYGAETDAAENGRRALELFEANPAGTYDVILMDCMMPVLDGYATTRAIRGLSRADAREIPIIAMTANAFSEDVKKCLAAGMNGHIAKPFEILEVVETIREHIAK